MKSQAVVGPPDFPTLDASHPVPLQDGRDEGREEVLPPLFLDPQFEIQRRAADAPGFAVSLAGFGVDASAG
jgi:hypothetical protein